MVLRGIRDLHSDRLRPEGVHRDRMIMCLEFDLLGREVSEIRSVPGTTLNILIAVLRNLLKRAIIRGS